MKQGCDGKSSNTPVWQLHEQSDDCVNWFTELPFDARTEIEVSNRTVDGIGDGDSSGSALEKSR
jgi:hypothetical protein